MNTLNSHKTFLLNSAQWERLELFLTCEPGWDGGDAKGAPEAKTVAEALQVLEFLRTNGIKCPCLFMGSSAEIEIAHISKNRQTYLNIECMGEGQFMIGWFDDEHETAFFVHSMTELPEPFIQAMRKLEEEEYGPTDEIGNWSNRSANPEGRAAGY